MLTYFIPYYSIVIIYYTCIPLTIPPHPGAQTNNPGNLLSLLVCTSLEQQKIMKKPQHHTPRGINYYLNNKKYKMIIRKNVFTLLPLFIFFKLQSNIIARSNNKNPFLHFVFFFCFIRHQDINIKLRK